MHPTNTALAPLASPTFTGDPKGPTPSAGDNDTSLATTAFVTAAIAAAVGSPACPPPMGRLSVATGEPVMTGNISGATSVFYIPYIGNIIPVWDGSKFVPQAMAGEISQALTDTTKSPAAAAASKIYDMFGWMDGATLRATRGPFWISDTVRGTGAGTSELVIVAGRKLNAQNITNGPIAQRGTWLGTVRTQASAVIDFFPRGGNEIGQPAIIPVWNAYNKCFIAPRVRDTTASWSVTAGAAYNNLNLSGNNRLAVTKGLAEDDVAATCSVMVSPGASGSCGINIMYDGLTAGPGAEAATAQAGVSPIHTSMSTPAEEGFHFWTIGQKATTANATFFGQSSGVPSAAAIFKTMY